MILDIDAGNTRIKWRVSDGPKLIIEGSQATAAVRQGASLEIRGANHIHRARISCVAGADVGKEIRRQLKAQFSIGAEHAQVTSHAAGLVCGYKNHLQLGVDRWLAIIAAYNNHPQSLVVVDLGSAATIDIIQDDGQHIGGYIVPGIDLMHKTLWQGTDRIKVQAKERSNIHIPGLSTNQAVGKGCVLLLVSMIESVVSRHQGMLIITGGDGAEIQDHLNIQARYYPDLVLQGLAVEGVAFEVDN